MVLNVVDLMSKNVVGTSELAEKGSSADTTRTPEETDSSSIEDTLGILLEEVTSVSLETKKTSPRVVVETPDDADSPSDPLLAGRPLAGVVIMGVDFGIGVSLEIKKVSLEIVLEKPDNINNSSEPLLVETP